MRCKIAVSSNHLNLLQSLQPECKRMDLYPFHIRLSKAILRYREQQGVHQPRNQ